MRRRPSRPPPNLRSDSNPLKPPVCHVISLLAHRCSCTRLDSDISDLAPPVTPEQSRSGEVFDSRDHEVYLRTATRRDYVAGGFLIAERPPPPDLRLDPRTHAIWIELFGPGRNSNPPGGTGDAPRHPSALRGSTNVKYNFTRFAGPSHLFDPWSLHFQPLHLYPVGANVHLESCRGCLRCSDPDTPKISLPPDISAIM